MEDIVDIKEIEKVIATLKMTVSTILPWCFNIRTASCDPGEKITSSS